MRHIAAKRDLDLEIKKFKKAIDVESEESIARLQVVISVIQEQAGRSTPPFASNKFAPGQFSVKSFDIPAWNPPAPDPISVVLDPVVQPTLHYKLPTVAFDRLMAIDAELTDDDIMDFIVGSVSTMGVVRGAIFATENGPDRYCIYHAAGYVNYYVAAEAVVKLREEECPIVAVGLYKNGDAMTEVMRRLTGMDTPMGYVIGLDSIATLVKSMEPKC
jgi:hypothetical protein